MIYAQETSTFRVVVAGGGVVGLTLANILERAGIDYILLEAKSTLTPELGASIAVQANGARILDQLGCYDPLLKTTIPIESSSFLRPDGTYVVDHLTDVQLFETRHGYPMVFHDRQALLKTLYENISDKQKCRPNSKILQAIQDDNGVTVQCEDGSIHRGSIIIGADGVRSKVREEMWRAANLAQPGLISEKEKNAMTAEYRCLYGICSKIPGITRSGDYHCSLDKHRSMMTIVSSPERTYFFVFEKLDRVYRSHEIPRFTEEDKEAFVERNSSIFFNQGVRFGDMYKHHIVSELVCMEEAEYKHWTWGRFVMAGDSIHKTTANQGSGGNQGIESAAVIVNVLKRMLADCGPKPTKEQIQAALQEYPKIHQKRTNTILGGAGKLTRIHALKGLSEVLTAYVTVPLAGDLLINMACETFVNSEYIEFLPVPARSLKGNMPYNQETGAGKQESRLKRFFLALPFLAIVYFTARVMDLDSVGRILHSIAEQPQLSWRNHSVSTAAGRITGLKPLDDFISGCTVAFTPSILGWDPVSRVQMIHFMVDLGVFYAILLIEGARRNNIPTFAIIPNVFAMVAQRLTIGLTGPVYFLLHYVFSAPIDRFNALDYRLTDRRYTNTVLIAMILFYHIPIAMSYGINGYPSSPETRLRWNAIWQIYPILAGLFQYIVARFFLKKTVHEDKMFKPLRDLPAINITMGILGIVSMVAWWSTILQSPFSIAEIFIPGVASSSGMSELMSVMRKVLQADQLASTAAVFLWLGMMHVDMYRAGMIASLGALFKVILLGGTIAALAGPGTATVCGFLYREKILATKKHKGAVTAERLVNADSMGKKQA